MTDFMTNLSSRTVTMEKDTTMLDDKWNEFDDAVSDLYDAIDYNVRGQAVTVPLQYRFEVVRGLLAELENAVFSGDE